MSRTLPEALDALLRYELPIDPVLADLASFGRAANKPLASASRRHVIDILDRFLSGLLTADQVRDWADLVECRADIAYPEPDRTLLVEAIFQLGNPNLRGDLSRDRAEAMRQQLVR